MRTRFGVILTKGGIMDIALPVAGKMTMTPMHLTNPDTKSNSISGNHLCVRRKAMAKIASVASIIRPMAAGENIPDNSLLVCLA